MIPTDPSQSDRPRSSLLRGVASLCFVTLLGPLATQSARAAGIGEDQLACGAQRLASEALVLHRQKLVLPDRGPQAELEILGGIQTADADGIAIIQTSDDSWAPVREFDLASSSVSIIPADGALKVQAAEFAESAPINEVGVRLELEDDDSALVDLPFAFPFYGRAYSQVYVQSDGNLTFLFPEHRSDPRSYSRAAFGPPRICPLFKDLDPSVGGVVRLDARSDAVTVSWLGVPVFSDDETGRPQTFQVTLGAAGDIEFRYGDVDVPNAVVGLFTGTARSGVDVVDWSEADASEFGLENIVAEVFVDERTLDEYSISHAFFREFEDAYDALIVFNDMDVPASPNSFAHQFTVRNEVRGIGDRDVDFGPVFGSPWRLSSFANMGPLSQYPAGPAEALDSFRGDTMVSILAHEVGHRYLAYPTMTDPQTGDTSTLLLGRQQAHWSFFFNSGASVLEGNHIVDNGARARPRFATQRPSHRYGEYDQYLMGLLQPNEVPPSFVVTRALPSPFRANNPLGNASRSPEEGVTFNGLRKEVSVQDIILEEGQRRPDTTVAQRHFRHAFALVVADGEQPKPESLATLQALRRAWVEFFDSNFGQRASLEVDLVRMLHLSTWPAAGLVVASPGAGAVHIAAPLETDFDVHLRADTAIASIPAVVTIPAGETRATFEMTGLSPGNATLTADAAVPGYDRAVTRLVVREGLEGLGVESGQREELVANANADLPALRFRVRDENLAHYSGVELSYCAATAEECPGGSVLTGPNGVARVEWPLADSGSEQVLGVEIAGFPETRLETKASVSFVSPAVEPLLTANAASGEALAAGQGFAPGSLITLFGSALADAESVYGTRLKAEPPEKGEAPPPPKFLPRELEGTRVSVAGVGAPLVSVAPGSVTLQVPFGVATDLAHVVVTTRFGSAPIVTIPVGSAHPGIFPGSVSAGNLPEGPEPFLAGSAAPMAGGSLVLHATGLGAVSPPGRTGRPGLDDPQQAVIAKVAALVDERDASVEGAILSTEEVGVYLVGLRLPAGLRAGRHSLQIVVDGEPSNTVEFTSE